MIAIVIGDEENPRIGLQENFPVEQIDAQHQTLPALMQPREQLAPHLESRCSVGRGVLDSRQSVGCETYLFKRGAAQGTAPAFATARCRGYADPTPAFEIFHDAAGISCSLRKARVRSRASRVGCPASSIR